MVLTKSEIQNLDKVRRLNIVNSITGIKPGNLVATKSIDGVTNVAIMSSVVHLSSNPALIGFITRPHGDYRRDTFNNIMETKCFTINHIHKNIIENAHFTSAKFEQAISEFDFCGLTEEYLENQNAPFVKESFIK
ncbi:MAG: flavin oxidoreductase, partial [Flavobacteriales bacterium]|nr:flavin oxidoreductase [Flavobacteriales bacterium]